MQSQRLRRRRHPQPMRPQRRLRQRQRPLEAPDSVKTALTIRVRPRKAHARVTKASRIGTVLPQQQQQHRQPLPYQRRRLRYRLRLLLQRLLLRQLLRAMLQKSQKDLQRVLEAARCGSTKAPRCITAPATNGTARRRKVNTCPRRTQWLRAPNPITGRLAGSTAGILGRRGRVSLPCARCMTRTNWRRQWGC